MRTERLAAEAQNDWEVATLGLKASRIILFGRSDLWK